MILAYKSSLNKWIISLYIKEMEYLIVFFFGLYLLCRFFPSLNAGVNKYNRQVFLILAVGVSLIKLFSLVDVDDRINAVLYLLFILIFVTSVILIVIFRDKV